MTVIVAGIAASVGVAVVLAFGVFCWRRRDKVRTCRSKGAMSTVLYVDQHSADDSVVKLHKSKVLGFSGFCNF